MTTTTLLNRDADLARVAKLIRFGLAGDDEFKAIGPENVCAAKADAGEIHYRNVVDMEVRAETAPRARSRRYVASDESIDRMGDIIRVAGWDLTNLKKNPQALWMHNAFEPIGTVCDFEKGQYKGKPALIESIDYYEEELSAKAAMLWKLVEAGKLKTTSVGFIPRKGRAGYQMDEDERKELGLSPYGMLFLKQEQLELSLVTIPANPNADEVRGLRASIERFVSDGQLDKALLEEFDCDVAKGIEEWKRPLKPLFHGSALVKNEADEPTVERAAPVEDREAHVPLTKPINVTLKAPTTPVAETKGIDDGVIQRLDAILLTQQALLARVEQVERNVTGALDVMKKQAEAKRVEDRLPENAPAADARSANANAFFLKVLRDAVEQVQGNRGR